MKTSGRSSGQKTLFQTWNKQTSTTSSKPSLFETWHKPNSSTFTSAKINQGTAKKDKKLDDIVDLGEDGDDDEFLAAINQLDSSCQDGNLSFSAKHNEDTHYDEIIPGFDSTTGNYWIYPTNYPIRNYQYNIVEKALLENTLVTLPTGLGKTFIAAVVMYNFYRWYPQGKIVFMAPTRPLVAQQIDACYNIMGIPQQDTAELTGSMAPPKRIDFWAKKRVFFLTPQVFQNDLGRGSCNAENIVCIVIDEAHKALGNHAYCQVVREILGYNKNFRILALSATPGDDIKAVQQVISNLLVSHIELRSEESPDIKPYSNQRQVEKIVLKLGDELEYFKNKFLRILNIIITRLLSNNVFWQRNTEKVSKYMLLMARDEFRKNCASGQQPRSKIGAIEGDFAVGISFYHAYELLLQHGLLSFYNFMKGMSDGSKGISQAKSLLMRNPDFISIMQDLERQIQLPADQCDGNTTNVSQKNISLNNGPTINPSFVGHPKLKKLKEIVLDHFRVHFESSAIDNDNGSRVMIFSQYRDSVQEIATMFSAYQPLVRIMSFIGQRGTGTLSKGLTQKEQLAVLRKFKSGGYNTLVATCVGEEGLDIGEVDLIVCFDASASPIRLVQRMGRTGRKRAGRIVVLVTEGKEEQVYQRSQRNKSNIHKTILERARTLDLYRENPRMIPRGLAPVCQKMFMTIEKISPKKSKQSEKKSEGDIKKLFLKQNALTKKDDGFLSPEELTYWHQHFKLPEHEAGLTPSKFIKHQQTGEPLGQQVSEHVLSMTEWLAWQTTLQPVSKVSHSKRTRHFAEILEFCDFRRDCGDDDDAYGFEMQSFLNRDDIIEPGVKKMLPQQHSGIMEWATVDRSEERNEKKSDRERHEEEIMHVPKENDRLQVGKCEKKKVNHKTAKKVSVIGIEDNVCDEIKINRISKDDGKASLKNKNTSGVKHNNKKRKIFDTVEGDRGSNESSGTDTTKIIEEARNQTSFLETKISKKKASVSNSKLKLSYKKRKSVDLEIDEDFEDVSFFNVKQRKNNKSPGVEVHDDDKGQHHNKMTPGDKVKHFQFAQNVCSKEQRSQESSGNDSIRDDDNSENGLSQLFDIPCSQRGSKPTEETLASKFPAVEFIPDAPSLETLLDLGTPIIEECSTSPTRDELLVKNRNLNKTPRTSKPRGRNDEVNNSRKQVNKDELFDQDLFDETTNKDVKDYLAEISDKNESHKEKFTPFTNSNKYRVLAMQTNRNFEKRDVTSSDVDLSTERCTPVESVSEGDLIGDVQTPCKQEKNIDEEFDNFGDGEILQDFRTPFLLNDDFENAEKGVTSENQNKSKEVEWKVDSKESVNEFGPNKDLSRNCGVVQTDTDARNKTRNSKVISSSLYGDKSIVQVLDLPEIEDVGKTGEEAILTRVMSHDIVNTRSLNRNSDDETLSIPTPVVSKNLQRKTLHVEKTILAKVSSCEKATVGCAHQEKIFQTNKNISVRGISLKKIRSFSYENVATEDNEKLISCVAKQFDSPTKNESVCEDADLVAPTPQREHLHSSFLTGKSGPNMSRSSSSFARKSCFGKEEGFSAKFQNNILKLKSRSNVSNKQKEVYQQTGKNDVVEKSGFKKSFQFPSSRVQEGQGKEESPLYPPLTIYERMSAADVSPIVIVSQKEGICSKDRLSKNVSPNELLSPKESNLLQGRVSSKELDLSKKNVPPKLSSKRKNLFLENISPNEPDSPKDPIPFTSVCFHGTSSSQGFCRENQINVSEVRSTQHNSSESYENDGSTDLEQDSPFSAIQRRKKMSKMSRKKVFESEESDDEREKEKKGLEEDESLIFNGQYEKKNCNLVNKGKRPRRMTDSDEEFEEKRTRTRKPGKRDLRLSKKRKPDIQERKFARQFLEEEAEVSDDAGVTSGDEVDGELEASFIDDRSQLTQRSPFTIKNNKNKKQVVDMMDIYRGSLMTPHRQQLRFSTPAFRRANNRYKMVYNKIGRSSSSSQAEEDLGMESFYESEEDCEQMNEEEMKEVVKMMDISPEQSQVVVRRPRRGKKNVLPESDFESPESTEEYNKHEPALRSPRNAGCPASRAVGGCSIVPEKSDHFEKPFPRMKDETFRRPVGGVRPHIREVVRQKMETTTETAIDKKSESNKLKDDMNGIIAALEESDECLMMEINNIPDFSSKCTTSTLSGASVTTVQNNDRIIVEPKSGLTCSKQAGFITNFPKRTDNEFGRGNCSVSKVSSLDCDPFNDIDDELIKLTDSVSNSKSDHLFRIENNNSNRKHLTSSSKSLNKTSSTIIGDNNKKLTSSASTTSNLSSTLFVKPMSSSNTSLQEIADSSKTFDVDRNQDKSVITSPMLTVAQRDKDKLTILVSSKEISNCQIASFLRRNHNIKAVVSKITGCDYIVSNRMAVERKLVSDISNASNMNKLIERIRELCDLYDRPCLVVEKDRLKKGETENKATVRTKHFNRVLACLTHVKILFSDNQEGTASILASLAQIEARKNAAIIYQLPLSKEKEQVVKFLNSIPRISYIAAVSLSFHYKTLQDILNSSAEDLVKRTKNLCIKRANDIVNYFQHVFCVAMVKDGAT